MLLRTVVLLAVVLCMGVLAGPAAGDTWDHLHLTVSDTAAAAEWYAKHFGGEVTKAGPFDAVLFGSNLVKFRGGGADVKGSKGSAVDHIAFSVADATAKAAELREDGAQTGAPNRRTKVVAIATDPWGTKIELLTDEDLLGFHHVHLKSTKAASTIEWYVKVFGGEPGTFENAAGITAIRYGGMYLFLSSAVREVTSTLNRSVDHLGWLLDDFEGTVTLLKGMGVKFLTEPHKSGGHSMAFIEGPDGVKIEIVEATG